MTTTPRYEIFFEELKRETDRGAAIVAAAMIDSLLRDLLSARLVPNPSGEDSLLDGANAPLSNLSSRTDACYRLGLISAKLTRDIHLIRRIRNDFAHDSTGCSFNDHKVQSRVSELRKSHGVYERSPKWKAGPSGPKSIRDDFAIAASGILAALELATSEAGSFAALQDEWIYSVSLDSSATGGTDEANA